MANGKKHPTAFDRAYDADEKRKSTLDVSKALLIPLIFGACTCIYRIDATKTVDDEVGAIRSDLRQRINHIGTQVDHLDGMFADVMHAESRYKTLLELPLNPERWSASQYEEWHDKILGHQVALAHDSGVVGAYDDANYPLLQREAHACAQLLEREKVLWSKIDSWLLFRTNEDWTTEEDNRLHQDVLATCHPIFEQIETVSQVLKNGKDIVEKTRDDLLADFDKMSSKKDVKHRDILIYSTGLVACSIGLVICIRRIWFHPIQHKR